MRFLSVLCTIFVVTLYSVSAWAHGTRGYMEKTDGIRIVAEYDDGEPMSYAAVEIKAPDSDIGFQNGRTDRNGYFLFQPDEPGQWQIKVKDGMGHLLALDFEVGADGAASETANTHFPMASEGMKRPVKVVVGLAIILGLSGFWYGWKARRAVA
jgi:nickel transport protein